MQMKNKSLKVLIAIAPFFVGIFYEWTSVLLSIFLIGYLLHCYYHNGKVRVPKSITLLSTTVIVCAYGLSVFWAVDHGMAVMGIVKFLPLPLFVLAIAQVEAVHRQELLELLPLAGFVMTLLSWGFSFIPECNAYFMINKRLGGFFQYPNTFALYLLLGIIILVTEEQWDRKEILLLIGLLTGIALSGSRTVFILLIITVIVFLFILKDKKKKLFLGGLIALLIIFTISYVFLTEDTAAIGRYLTASLSSSTLIGRILYMKDAIPVILKNPLGLGYMGYYFMQGSFQTGVYSVLNVHNELLQILLDIGWIPAIVFIVAVACGIRKGNLQSRMLIIMLAIHCMVDFDLQFIAVFLILLTVIYCEEKKTYKNPKKTTMNIVAGILICFNLYFGCISGLYYLNQNTLVLTLYPYHTNSLIQLLTETKEAEEMDQLADRILRINEYSTLAYSAKARAAYSDGDFANVIVYKKKAIETAKYDLEEYLDYFNMLYIGYQLYSEKGDVNSAQVCIQCMLEIPEMIEDVLDNTDSLAYKIVDKPELELPGEYLNILKIFVSE